MTNHHNRNGGLVSGMQIETRSTQLQSHSDRSNHLLRFAPESPRAGLWRASAMGGTAFP
jgi:hypothetical protein